MSNSNEQEFSDYELALFKICYAQIMPTGIKLKKSPNDIDIMTIDVMQEIIKQVCENREKAVEDYSSALATHNKNNQVN